MDDAVELFRRQVVPALREEPGYEGAYVLATPDGKGMIITLWTDEEAAEAGLASGFYAEQVQRFVTFFRSPPGRETYEVRVVDTPGVTIG
ncbi:MAG: antibiotic biosynthesis monooxygenase [Thermoleophilia bacterium]|nr:antibiotic biosynthesis monooxygenase [Thermoleophilia bacterium]